MLNNKIFLALAIAALIAGVESQANCTPTSPQCCWVVRSWQLMGMTTTVSSTSSTACCSMTGVTCDSTNKVTMLYWNATGLKNSIPSSIGNLINLQILYYFLRFKFKVVSKEINS